MSYNLAAALPIILPKAIAWAEECASQIATEGTSLNDAGISVAQRVGVANPHLIRVSIVDRLPLPTDPELRDAALGTGLLGPSMIGLTLGYGVYICGAHNTLRLLSHEFRHVYQYELAGSIGAFLPVYLQQIVQFGYSHAPFELDARAHEIHA